MQYGGMLNIIRVASRLPSVFIFSFVLQLFLCNTTQAQTACERDVALRANDPPVSISYSIDGGTFVTRLVADVLNPTIEADQVVADLSLSFTVEASLCPRPISFPLGLTFRNARFPISNPSAISVPTSTGIANVTFDPDRLSATLLSVLPLPPFLQYRVYLKTASTDVTGTTIVVELVAPNSLGVIASGEWVVNLATSDFGLRELAQQLGGGQLPFTKDAAAVKADFVAKAKLLAGKLIASKTIDIGHAGITNLSIDWSRWERGDKVLSGDLTWHGTPAELAAALPAKAELRFSDGQPRLSLAPLDLNQLKKVVADQVSQRIGDPNRLAEMVRRFGRETARDMPLGWLRIRNANVTTTKLSAQLGFAIGDEDPAWERVDADLPLTTATFSQAAAILAVAAEKSIASYLAKTAEGAVYEKVLTFLDRHKADTFNVFGLSVTLAPVVPKGGILPLKPIVVLSASATGVTITNVGLTVEGDKPIFDWSAATVEGMPALKAALLKASGLVETDFGFQIKNLSFVGGEFAGLLVGSLLGTPFEAPFKISESNANLALPDTSQIIVAALKKAVTGKSLSVSGLTLSDINICPDRCQGNQISARARVRVSDYFEGSVTLRISPKIALENLALTAGSGLTAFTSLPTGPVSISPPTQFNPLVIDGVIKISQLFGAIPVPDIPFRYLAATGKLELAFPTVIAINTDVPIPPWLNLSQVRIPVGKSADGIIEIGVRMTLGQHYVQYIFNVDGTLRANPKHMKVDLSGGVSLLTLPLLSAEGTVDFAERRMRFNAQTKGELAKLLALSSEMTVDGQTCMASQQQKIKVLFVEADGFLIVQVPPDLCGSVLPSASTSCGIGGSGGVCLKGQANAGVLGSVQATLSAGYDLKFRIAIQATMRLLFEVQLKIEGDAKALHVDGRVPKLAKFSFVIPVPDANSDQMIKQIIDQILDALKNPKIQFPIEISVSGGKVKVDGAIEGDNTSPGPAPGPNPPPGPAPGPNPPPGPAPGPNPPPGPAPGPNPPPTVKNLGRTGPIQITFDEQRRLVATNLDTGSVTRSADPVDPASVELSKTACFGWVTWITANPLTNAAPEASVADGWVFRMEPSCALPSSIACPAGAMCAAGVRNGGARSGPLDFGSLKWPSATRIISSPELATDLEYGLMRAKARARLFPQKGLVPVDGEWRCAVVDGDSCKAALEWDASGPVAFASASGSTFALSDGSLLKWAANQPNKAPSGLFEEINTSDLKVLGQSAEGWLVERTQTNNGQTVSSHSFLKSAGGVLPVNAASLLRSPGQKPWETGKTNILLDQAAQTIGRSTAAGTWQIDDPGEIAGGSRLLLMSDTIIILLSATENARGDGSAICRRETSVVDATKHPVLDAAQGPTLTAKLHNLVIMEPDTWRQRGLRANPVLSLFGNACQ